VFGTCNTAVNIRKVYGMELLTGVSKSDPVVVQFEIHRGSAGIRPVGDYPHAQRSQTNVLRPPITSLTRQEANEAAEEEIRTRGFQQASARIVRESTQDR